MKACEPLIMENKEKTISAHDDMMTFTVSTFKASYVGTRYYLYAWGNNILP